MMPDKEFKNITENDIKSVELRSEEVQEIIGAPPSKILRYGLSSILGFLIILIIGSIYFKFPEIITGRFMIISSNPPVYLKAKKSGLLVNVFQGEQDSVTPGSIIAVIEDPANYKDILLLEDKLNSFRFDSVFNDPINKSLVLGEVQNYYIDLQKNLQSYQDYFIMDFYSNELKSLIQRKKIILEHLSNHKVHLKLKNKEVMLAKDEFVRDSLLKLDGVISQSEYSKSEQKYLQICQGLEQINSSYLNTQLELNTIEESILKLGKEQNDKILQFRIAIEGSIDQLKSQISIWKEKNMIISPINGSLSFSNVWEKNQYAESDQTIVTIVPHKQNTIIGKVIIPIKRAGKIKVGQSINLKFDNYPSQEFGMLTTRLEGISLVPDSAYFGSISLPDTLITNYNIVIPFGQNLQGEAEIITEDMSLMSRLINPLKELMKRQLN
jgi:hypothetical protein